MGMMGGLGMMSGNPLQSLLALRAPGLDMGNPVIAQLMMQQVGEKRFLLFFSFHFIIFFIETTSVYKITYYSIFVFIFHNNINMLSQVT